MRQSGPLANGANKIVPSGPQVPPLARGASARTVGRPPPASIRYSFLDEELKKPIERPSGDQNGNPLLIPAASGLASVLLRLRSHSCGSCRGCFCRLRQRILNIKPRVAYISQPLTRIFPQRAPQQLPNDPGSTAGQTAPVRFSGDDAAQNFRNVVSLERWPPRQHFVQHGTKREDVRPSINRTSLRLFGGHVGRCSQDQSSIRSGHTQQCR